jgi:hypothetical protein
MKTRVVTTNPAGHTVSIFDGKLSAYQVADIYQEYYRDISIWHEESTIPDAWYLRCFYPDGDSILYQVKWS